jgi:hypothetical protein
MNLSPDEWRIAVDLAQFTATSGVGIAVWLMGRDRVRREQIARLENTMDGRLDQHAQRISAHEARLSAIPDVQTCNRHMERVAAIEGRANSAPTHGDIARVHQRLDGQSAALSELTGGLKRVEHLLDTLHQHLLDNAVVAAPPSPRRA